ncbi:hypothetical protein CEXT_644141 [Caerostris extrusa]|uniref:Uncharacterized protein n=1 Tax=Caerostris extrusa TaxID=172846 RepID=A0AAV4TWS3_CAEEX|nr:hypothetical protein CEXT_644141 [Caerostris extrusa]
MITDELQNNGNDMCPRCPEDDNGAEEKSPFLVTAKLIPNDLQLCIKLENHFLVKDPNCERTFQLQHSFTSILQWENDGKAERTEETAESSNQR